MQKFSVLIIGAGRVGAFFDTPESVNVLTHAHAFYRHPGFQLIGFVDSDFQSAQRASSIWGGKPFSNLSDAFAEIDIDIVVVAAPDDFHADLLTEVAIFSVKLVLVEKPLAINLTDAKKIINLYGRMKIPLTVNYTRRFVPDFLKLKQSISSGKFGKYLVGSGYYGKGILHNGSHMIDLARFLLGEVRHAYSTGSIVDWSASDPSHSAILSMECGPLYLQAVDSRCFTIFELDLVFECRRIRIIDSGFLVEERGIAQSSIFKDYQILEEGNIKQTSLSRANTYLANNIYEFLTGNFPLACTGFDGLAALKVVEQIVATSRL